MRFCSLGSGSSGNSYLVKNEQTLLVVDCGFSLSEFEIRMSQKEINPEKTNIPSNPQKLRAFKPKQKIRSHNNFVR